MNFIGCSLFYTIEIFKIILMAFFLMGIKPKSKSILFYTVSVTIVFSGFLGLISLEWAENLDGLIIFAMSLIILRQKKDFGYIILSYLYISIIDNVIRFIFFRKIIDQLDNNSFLNILSNVPSMIVLLMLVYIRYKKISKNDLTQTRKSVLILAMGAFGLTLALSAILSFSLKSTSIKLHKLKLFFIFLSVLYLAVFVLYIINRIQNDRLMKQNKEYSQVMKLNEEYYSMLKKKEDETRAFRHDIKAHLYSLQTLYNEKKFEEFEKYLSDLTEKFNEISHRIATGNTLMNAIINDISSKYPDVSIQWNGIFSEDITIDSIDLCTIFSNLLNNAFEAASLTEEKKVSVLVKTLESSMYVSIRNSANSEPQTDDNGFVSNKNDRFEHGYGLRNVISCLDKLGGSFDILYENCTVIVDVILSDALKVTKESD